MNFPWTVAAALLIGSTVSTVDVSAKAHKTEVSIHSSKTTLTETLVKELLDVGTARQRRFHCKAHLEVGNANVIARKPAVGGQVAFHEAQRRGQVRVDQLGLHGGTELARNRASFFQPRPWRSPECR